MAFIHFIPIYSSNYLADAGLLVCSYLLFLFHRTGFSLSNQVPINVSSENLILFFKKGFSLSLNPKIVSPRLCIE